MFSITTQQTPTTRMESVIVLAILAIGVASPIIQYTYQPYLPARNEAYWGMYDFSLLLLWVAASTLTIVKSRRRHGYTLASLTFIVIGAYAYAVTLDVKWIYAPSFVTTVTLSIMCTATTIIYTLRTAKARSILRSPPAQFLLISAAYTAIIGALFVIYPVVQAPLSYAVSVSAATYGLIALVYKSRASVSGATT